MFPERPREPTGWPAIARRIWETKYRRLDRTGKRDAAPADTWRRVAAALAKGEPRDRGRWQRYFLDAMRSLRFLPGGRIIAGAGAQGDATLFNCFVLPPPRDGVEARGSALDAALLTMRRGGGIGFDASCLAPQGGAAPEAAPGPVAHLIELDSRCDAQMATCERRGAVMATLRCDHPDIARFIAAKERAGALAHFNLSVQVCDEFMAAIEDDAPWPLVFPARGGDAGPMVWRRWSGGVERVACRVVATVPARTLWDLLLRSAFATAEPGVLFVDRINALNNLWYREEITATNPCGEVPLPANGACALGSLNLMRFIRDPFTASAAIDEPELVKVTRIAVRLLDNTIDRSAYPMAEQRTEAHATRRVGIGIMGLADALVMVGLRYDSSEARAWADRVMRMIADAAYRTSIALAKERGPFPLFGRDAYLAGGFIATLPRGLRDAIARHGIRNSHLLAIAPTGSISLLAGAVSSGMEPIYAADYARVVRENGQVRWTVTDPAVALWRERTGPTALPRAFVPACDISPEDQLAMQAVLQRHVDGAISKTVLVAPGLSFERFCGIYRQAHALGLKGCTIFRAGTVRGSVIAASDACCRDRGPSSSL